MKKPKIILHGAGSIYLEHAFSYFKDRFEICAITDNDSDLFGTEHNGIPIILPSSICKIDYDFIVICCSAYKANQSVFRQLIMEYMVEPRRIIENTWVLGNKLLSLLYVSNLLAQEVVKGAVAEYEVHRGDYAMYMNMFFYDRKLYLYDNFETLSTEGKTFDNTVELVMKKMLFPNNCVICEGHLDDLSLKYEKFSFVSLGSKEYETTYKGLTYFYPQMTKGGVLFIQNYHDKSHAGVRKATVDFIKEYSITQYTEEEGALFVIVKSGHDAKAK